MESAPASLYRRRIIGKLLAKIVHSASNAVSLPCTQPIAALPISCQIDSKQIFELKEVAWDGATEIIILQFDVCDGLHSRRQARQRSLQLVPRKVDVGQP